MSGERRLGKDTHPLVTEPRRRTLKNARDGHFVGRCFCLVAFSAATSLVGCAVGPTYERPDVKLNAEWVEQQDSRIASQTAPDAERWKSFSDPVLNQLIELAYGQNLTLQVTGLRILEARARLGYAHGQRYPQVQVAVGGATVNEPSELALNTIQTGRFYDYQVGFDASWEVDFWGRYAKGVTAEESGYLSTVADYDNALVSLASEVARTYTSLRTFEVLINLARENVTVQEEGLRIAQARFDNGATSELDVTQARTLLESTRATIPQLEASRQQAENALSTLLGQTTGSIRQILAAPAAIPAPPAQVSISVPAEMLRRRADIRAAELNAMAQSDRVGIAQTDFYPRIALFGSVGSQVGDGDSVSSSFSDLLSSGSWFYTFGPRMLWTVFNYGRIKNNVRVEDARFQASLVSYQDTVLRAGQEVDDALAGFLRSQEAAVFARNAADSAQQSVDLAFVQYREGAVDFQRVLDAQRSLLQEANTLADIDSSVATNLIALYKALGGGWEMRQNEPYINDANRDQMQKRTNWGEYFSETPSDVVSDR
jgi:NodT family efflux transporter outer membrane factor (OMF) lipoprotein